IDSFDEIGLEIEDIDVDSPDTRYFVNYAVKNIIKETVTKNSTVFLADSEDKIICILNTNENPLNIAEEIRKTVYLYLKTTISIAISLTHNDYSNISLCYLEASTVFERSMMLSQGDIFEYSQIPQNYSEYAFSTDKELSLINSIKSGSYDDAERLINNIFEQNISSTSLYKCIIFDITGAILKAIDVIYKVYDDKGFNPNNTYLLDDISSCNSITETKEKILNVISIFCEIVNQHKSTKNTKLKAEILDFIENSYTNGELSIQHIADNLNRNPSYISRYFKEQMGMNLLEYINLKRIEYAKELLTQNLKITDVAEKSGFQNSASFIRVFKKVTGTTPGKYKINE
ncbi:MAG: helix-turn-helix transcriptional regulator, partial [Clostridia bacterium]|nr:helix-turn-helix transcriptional regulator [Clostridia bacterium]